MLARYYGDVPNVIVEPGVRTGVQLAIDNPKEVGADRVVNTLAAYTLYGGPSIVVDFGTTTNFDVISARGEFLGGAFAPGIEISFDALAARAAQLRKVEPAKPRSVIGKNTVECLQSGHVLRVRRPGGPHRRADDRGAGRGDGGDRHRRAGAGGASTSAARSPTTSR